jgi:hypothetical protein
MQRLAAASPKQLIMVAFVVAVVIVLFSNRELIKAQLEQ